MDLSMSNSRKPWWGKQYGLTNVQLYGHINAQQQKTLVGQAVWTFQCSGADFWWGKQYGHFTVQEQTFGGASSMDILVSRMLVATVVRTDWQPPCMATYLGLMELKFLPMARRFRCLFLAISGTSVFKSPSKSAHTNPMNKTECREQLI